MEEAVENYFEKKVFYRCRGNFWKIPVKTKICNTFTKSNSSHVFYKEFAYILSKEQLF